MNHNRAENRLLPKIDSEWFRNRILMLIVFISMVFALLGARLFYLQIVRGEHYRSLSTNNSLRKQRIEPLRGLIYDRNGRLLVDNRPSYDLRIIPNDARPLDQTAERLAGYIDMEASEIKSHVRENRGPYGYAPVLLKKDINRDLMGILLARSYELPGITIATNARRNYIYDPLAAHLIGYLGEITEKELSGKNYPHKRGGDMVGRAGVEKTFESELSGTPGARIVQVSATGQVMRVIDREPAKAGHNLYLTIDSDLQEKAESLLADQVGAVVAMDPDTGEVLAMASSPGFRQAAFVDGLSDKAWRALTTDPERPLRNKAVQGKYPPASTYKIVTAMAALEEGVMGRNTEVFCPGYMRFGNRIYRCWKLGGHGTMDIVEAIAQSCDVYFYQAGKQLGVDRIAKYAKQSGLGASTGIALAHEAAGLIPTAEWKRRNVGVPWQPGENLSIAIGQGYNLVTPLQMAVLTSAVANDGTFYQPKVMKQVRSVQGRSIKTLTPEPMGKLPASDRSLEIIQKGLYDVVNKRNGTAYWHVRAKDVSISGKTGTAQVVGRREEPGPEGEKEEEKRKRKYLPHAWFIGYAPSEQPEIAVSVLIEHGEHGSSTAGPIAREVMMTYLNRKAAKAVLESGENGE